MVTSGEGAGLIWGGVRGQQTLKYKIGQGYIEPHGKYSQCFVTVDGK